MVLIKYRMESPAPEQAKTFNYINLLAFPGSEAHPQDTSFKTSSLPQISITFNASYF